MKLNNTEINGVVVIEAKVLRDQRSITEQFETRSRSWKETLKDMIDGL